MRLRFGIRFNGDSGTIAEVVRLAQIAEEAGFDDVWYCQDLMKRDAWVVLTAIALATTHVRVGTAIVNPFSCDPSELAMRVASLHEVSGGRAILGIGAGEQSYLAWVGKRQAKPATGVREAVAVLRRLLAGEAAEFQGTVFSGWTHEARLQFPIFTPSIPIYIGGQGPAMLRMIGELGDGGLPILFPPNFVASVMAHIRAGALSAERPLSAIDVAGCVWYALADDAEAARAALRPLIAYYGPALRTEVLAPIGLSPDEFAAIATAQQRGDRAVAEELVTDAMFRLAIVGTPDTVIPQIIALVNAGVTQINIGPPFGPHPATAIRLTGERVIPHVRDYGRMKDSTGLEESQRVSQR